MDILITPDADIMSHISMKRERKNMNHEKTVKIVVSAMFAALCCVATMIIQVPTVGTSGYVNIGDTIVLLCAWLIGGVYGAAAAGIGSALADLLASYVPYAPGTFVIKFLMAVVAFVVFKGLTKIKVNKVVSYVASAVLAECVMIGGYFVYESWVLGYGVATAAPSIGSNAIQAGTCLVLGVILVEILEVSGAMKRVRSEMG